MEYTTFTIKSACIYKSPKTTDHNEPREGVGVGGGRPLA